MPKSSINFKPVKSTSESHNNRVSELNYVRKDRFAQNESWVLMSIPEKREMILDVYKSFHTRKMQKNAEPIREAVVNIEPRHTIEDLKKLGAKLKEKFDVECFQIHIHKDEGMWVNQDGDKVDSVMINGKPDHGIKPEGAVNWNENYHAHMLFDWQEKRPEIYKTYKKKGEERQELMSGKSKKMINYSHAQDITAETLGMQRGEAKANTNRERLEALEYKRQQEQLHLQRVLQSIDEALKKKNRLSKEQEELLKKLKVQEQNAQDLKEKSKKLRVELSKVNSTPPKKESQNWLSKALSKEKKIMKKEFLSLKLQLNSNIESLKNNQQKLEILTKSIEQLSQRSSVLVQSRDPEIKELKVLEAEFELLNQNDTKQQKEQKKNRGKNLGL